MAKSHSKLEDAIQEHMREAWGENAQLVTHWVVVAAGVDSDGEPRIMAESSDMPDWQHRGLIGEHLASFDREE